MGLTNYAAAFIYPSVTYCKVIEIEGKWGQLTFASVKEWLSTKQVEPKLHH